MASAPAPTIELAHGPSIPRLGLGTAGLTGEDAVRTISSAIDMGYRLLDTAFAYGNEEEVGRGLRESAVAREDVIVTTKFNRESHSVAGAHQAFADSARLLGV
jgi:2,5-diketo-D-gluconate reductase A